MSNAEPVLSVGLQICQ